MNNCWRFLFPQRPIFVYSPSICEPYLLCVIRARPCEECRSPIGIDDPVGEKRTKSNEKCKVHKRNIAVWGGRDFFPPIWGNLSTLNYLK